MEFILGLPAQGATSVEILEECDKLTAEDLRACFFFATKSFSETDFMTLIEAIPENIGDKVYEC